MMKHELTQEDLKTFYVFLRDAERSKATIDKYMRDVRKFYEFLGENRWIEKEKLIEYKALLKDNYKISSANSMLAALNSLLGCLGLGDYRVKSFKYQRQLFCSKDRLLSKEEYGQLVETARGLGKERLELIMQTICATGIRVGELSYITVEAVIKGVAKVQGKGKQRSILISDRLRNYLLEYCRKENIGKGSVFLTRTGRPVNRTNVWGEMKALCSKVEVLWKKVFPHNLRHLFARTCYQKQKDIVYLADILGHSNIETTRIYTISSGEEHEQRLSQLGLVI